MSQTKLLIYIILIFSGHAVAQTKNDNGFESHLRSTYWNINLHGPVKTARMFYTYVNPNLKNYERGAAMRNDIRYKNYLKFSIDGLMLEAAGLKDSISEDIKEIYLTRYYYNNSDLLNKSQYKIKKRNKFPARDSKLLTRADFKGKTQKYSHLVYSKYLFEDDTVVMLEQYSLIGDTLQTEDLEEHLTYKMTFKYDQKQNVVRQDVVPGKLTASLTFLCFDTEVGYCEDTGISYEYDNQDRLTKVTLTGCGRIAEEEKYTYAVGEDYIEKIERKIDGQHGFPTGNMTAYYNEFGDIIEMQFKANSELAKPWDPRGPRYYEYTYDSHNNWTECRMYLMGNKKEPTIIASRILEYY